MLFLWGPFQEGGYHVGDESTKSCSVLQPPGDPPEAPHVCCYQMQGRNFVVKCGGTIGVGADTFLGVQKIFPEFPQTCPKNFLATFCAWRQHFGWPPKKNVFISFWVPFFQIKASWTPFLLVFSWGLPRFSGILQSFSQIFTDFQGFCPNFHQMQIGGALAALPPTPLGGQLDVKPV